MTQTPSSESFLLKWRGDTLAVTLRLDSPRKGRAAFRTNVGNARVRRREIIAETERGETPLAKAWRDVPMAETSPGVFTVELPLDEVGVFSGKACFFPEGSSVPEWPEGRNLHVKVGSAATRKGNSIYTVFPRQFGSFREVARRLDHIMGRMGFRIIQTLPPFPVPVTYGVMGEYGCPFAATDFLSVDPAMAEFDRSATPLDQFVELVDAVHARDGLFFVDLPANHTGWASTLQSHHPDWFRRERDGSFHSPGAWGVRWDDLVELDYSHPELRAYMADVFLFWCRRGVDGFRCDAGYMIPLKTWEYVVARVREEYPDTVFMLEGLGGELKLTDSLLAEANLDWAYSEIFQTYDRGGFEWYLPGAIARSEKYGTLVHFAETHDNDRLAKGGETYARLRVGLAALLSWQGAWGIANGVEWFCREKIDVHGKNDLAWGNPSNMVDFIARLNFILSTHPAFAGAGHLELVTRGDGNTLAVARDGLLVLANLDCRAETAIGWDRAKFPFAEAFDLLTERKVVLSDGLRLGPGEVLCLASAPKAEPERKSAAEAEPGDCLVHWRFPRDAKRTVVAPQGEEIEISAARPFRAELIDPETGRTLCALRAHAAAGDSSVRLVAPSYRGDGTRCRALELAMTVYEADRAGRTRSRILVPPPAAEAKVKLSLSGEEVRRRPNDRAILSNGAGAAAQVRAGWGTVASQYDAFLAANPNPNVPSDRLNLWTRMRVWLQREGYVREFDARCVRSFAADPSGRFARWDFRMPCGMGCETAFSFVLSLVPNVNAAVLRVVRTDAGADDAGGSVRLVFRPDVEWRSFHANTKAYQGPDALFPASARPRTDGREGFLFSPYGETLSFSCEGGVYHHEPAWCYNVGHPEEAARGQEGAGDLFSPGWISSDLSAGGSVSFACSLGTDPNVPLADAVVATQTCVDRHKLAAFGTALKSALDLYVVRRDGLKTVIAGYPWFLDWGRDTFIFLRALIADGRLDDSLRILQAFAAFEENGTLPNVIRGETADNRDTTDAQLWFIRCVEELEEKLGGRREEVVLLRKTCESIVDNYLKGTPNGIRVDAASGLVWSPAHFTWMDTNYPACTPRTGYPVEIQALWIGALKYLGRGDLASRALASVEKHFRISSARSSGSNLRSGFCDCLSAPNGEPASEAVPDTAVRPNQLFLVTLGVLDDPSVLRATEELVVPGGMRSLAAGHPLYSGVYAGDEDTRRKPAYHNGTVWGWVFPLYAEALVRTKSCSPETARALLASSVETLNAGCLCHASENADGDAPHAQKGCTAQAWSDSELYRVWLWLESVVLPQGGTLPRCQRFSDAVA